MRDGNTESLGGSDQEPSASDLAHCLLPDEPAEKSTLERLLWVVSRNLSGDYLQSQGRQLHLVPGMQVNAAIHLGTRSVIEYLLLPVQKIA